MLKQTLSDAVLPGAEYNLTFLVGDRIGALGLIDYDVELSAGGVGIISENSVSNISLRPANDNGKATLATEFAGQFLEVTLSGIAPSSASGPLMLSFGAGGNFAGNGGLVAFDNVRLSVVPEPNAAVLLSIAALSAVRRRR